MGKGLSYTDAVRLMGGHQSKTVKAMDRLAGGSLLAASAAAPGFGASAAFALSLFNAKGELARLSGELVQGMGQSLRKLKRFTQTERLAAAHSVVVLTAYFDVLGETDLPFNVRALELTAAEEVALVGGGAPGSNRLRALAAGLLQANVPMPTPQLPYEAAVEAIRGFYERLSDELLRFVTGLAVYEQLDETNRHRFAETLSDELPSRAVIKYQERFRQLAVEFPEFSFWTNQVDHQATRERIRGGLEGLERVLADIASGRLPDERRLGLSRAYRAVLDRPVLTSAEVPEGFRLPTLGEAYVNPDFRVAEAVVAERLAQESWWKNQQPPRGDLEGFLFGYLTAPQAVEAPLLLLGEPGSGKSVLTQVLAARLPPDKFLVVRVVLREVAVDADLQTQIEHAVRSATGESLTWPDLARSAGDALPVVLLDGFDELLQATGVSQTDYLKKVADFQRREADQGRPVVVVVTSRTAVADRAQPTPGMVALRLEPFSDAHIGKWLGIWNDANATAFTGDLKALTPEIVRTYAADLASQPLLLLLLTLYDADANALQRGKATFGKAELYERLLTGFAEREIKKTQAFLPPGDFELAVERELLRLSVVAFAMFNRRRQWASEAELDDDLPALLIKKGKKDAHTAPDDLDAWRLSAAQVVIGRFWFVYVAQATRDNAQLKTYEFLHATFGEYLIARLVTRVLRDFADDAEYAASRRRPFEADDAFLHALLSYMPLTMRDTVVSFTAEHLRTLPEPRRHLLGDVLLGLFHDSLHPRHDTWYGGYTPLEDLPVPARYAAYSANLVILAVLTSGQVTGTGLFPASNPAEDWLKLAMLWRSQLPPEGWDGLIDAIALDRTWDGDQRNIVLHPSETGEHPPWGPDLLWDLDVGPGHEHRTRDPDTSSTWWFLDNRRLRDQARFMCDAGDDALVHALEPLAGNLGPAITAFSSFGPVDRAVSPANALITMWLTSGSDSTSDELAAAYDTCLKFVTHGFAPFHTDTREQFRILVLRQLSADQDRVPPIWLKSVAAKIQKAGESEWALDGAALLRLAHEILPELMGRQSCESAQSPEKPGDERE